MRTYLLDHLGVNQVLFLLSAQNLENCLSEIEVNIVFGEASSEYLGHGSASRSWFQGHVSGNCGGLIGISVTIRAAVRLKFLIAIDHAIKKINRD